MAFVYKIVNIHKVNQSKYQFVFLMYELRYQKLRFFLYHDVLFDESTMKINRYVMHKCKINVMHKNVLITRSN